MFGARKKLTGLHRAQQCTLDSILERKKIFFNNHVNMIIKLMIKTNSNWIKQE